MEHFLFYLVFSNITLFKRLLFLQNDFYHNALIRLPF